MSYEPFESAFWNLVQALAWIYLGDRQLVKKAADDFDEHGSFMQELKLSDGRIDLIECPGRRPDLMTLSLLAGFKGGARFDSVSEAESALLEALQRGELRAWGLKNNTGELIEIAAVQWTDLRFYYSPDHARPRDFFRVGATSWHSLQFSVQELLSLWPDVLNRTCDNSASPSDDAPLQKKARRGRPPAKFEAAKHVVLEIYPEGIPAELSRAAFNEAVNERLIARGKPRVSEDTTDRIRGRQ